MERVVVTIEGTSEEVVHAFQKLSGLVSVQGISYVQAVDGIQEDWTEQEFLYFWTLLTDGAKDVFREVALQPEGCPRDAVAQNLGVSGGGLAGRLSSQGHALRRFQERFSQTKPKPLELDWETWEYKMRPEVAEIIIRLEL